MSQLRAQTSSVDNRSDLQQNMPALGIVPLRPSPVPAMIVQNLAASLIGNIQEDIRCACYIDKVLYTGDNQGKILRWNPLDASRTIFYDGLGAPVNVVVCINENKDIWTGLANGNITILNLESQSIKNQMIHAHDAAVNCITTGIQCTWSGGDDFLIKKWDMGGVELFTYNHHHGFIKDLFILYNNLGDKHIRLWSASSDASISVAALQDNRAQHSLLSDIKMLSGHAKGVLALCLVSADTIWSGCEDGSIGVWSSLGVLRKQVKQAHKGPIGSFVVMGVHVWSGSGDRTVLVWESSSCQLLFSLGDHGGFVKSMIRVDYMCWIFASGKNVRIWCAQSVWDTYEDEKDRQNRNLQGLKESLEKAQREKQEFENSDDKFREDLQVTQQQLNEERSNGAFALEKINEKIEKLKSEHMKTLEILEANKEYATKNAGNLEKEIKFILEKHNKLKVEKEVGEKAMQTKVKGLEKDLEELGEKHTKTLEDVIALKKELENLRTELQKAQGDLKHSQERREDLLVTQNVESKKVIELEKSLKLTNDRNLKLQNELAISMNDKEDVDKARTIALARYDEERTKFEEKMKQLQNDLDRAHESANANTTIKDIEMQKLQSELKKKIKELKKVMKEVGEVKKGSAKEQEKLKEIIDQLKKSKDSSSSAEVANNEKLTSISLELQKSHDGLQNALSDKALILEERDKIMQKMREDHLQNINDLQQALIVLQVENEKLQGLINENEENARVSKKTFEEASKILKNDINKTKAFLDDSSKERDNVTNDAITLRKKLKKIEEDMIKLKDLENEKLQGLIKESKETTGISRKVYEQASGALKDDLSKTKILLDGASKERDEVAKDATNLREKLKEIEKSMMQLKNSENEKLQGKKSGEITTTSREAYEEAFRALKEDLNKTTTLLADTSKERDEAMNDVVGLREKLQEIEENVIQLKDSVATSDAFLQALTKERDEMWKRCKDAAWEIEKLKDELSQVSKQKPIDLEKLLVVREKKYSEELACLSNALDKLMKEKDKFEELLAQASAGMEKLRTEKTYQDDITAHILQELDQLKKHKNALKEKMAQKTIELDMISLDLDHTKNDKEVMETTLDHIKKDKAKIDEKFIKKNMELHHALQKKSSKQDIITRISKELEELKAQSVLSDEKLFALVREINEIKRSRQSQEELATQKATELDQVMREMKILCFEIKQKEDKCRLAKEDAMLVAAIADAHKIEELQNKIARLEMKLEDVLTRAQVTIIADDPIWARVQELEAGLMQAHMDYRILNQEIRYIRNRREGHKDNEITIDETRNPYQVDGLDVALKMMQPGFRIDYTTLKVSSVGNQERDVNDIEVREQNPRMPQRIIPISHPEIPQRIVSIRAPSPTPEMINPILSPRPHSNEKERYFPSHGPMRVLRGLSPRCEQ